MSTDADIPATHLSALLDNAARRRGDHTAVADDRGTRVTYRELHATAEKIARWLAAAGVGRHACVGLCMPKSAESVAAIHGILRSGAAYVPVDPTAPAMRSAGILASAGISALIVEQSYAPELLAAWPDAGRRGTLKVLLGQVLETAPVAAEPPLTLPVADCRTWSHLIASGTESETESGTANLPPADVSPDDLAYILYTSGSTGTPKGVMLTHTNAFTFLNWCDSVLATTPEDQFSSHAPFHFDLSVFDIYVCCRRGATLHVIGETLAREPTRLGAFAAERGITVWYSAPSILALMSEFGHVDGADYPAPRLVLFAGEVFPIRQLRRLREQWPKSELWNLYGPTETNVCTAYPIPETIPADRNTPYPIGWVCPPLQARVVDDLGLDVTPGTRGELVIAGPGVLKGYHNQPDLTVRAFLRDDEGVAWYRTGDLVSEPDKTGCYVYHGRRDRMIKKRGYRIELGEIESALYRNEQIERAAVVAETDPERVAIAAFVVMKAEGKKSLIAMKRHCTQYLPHYMVPDTITFLPAMPTTSTDKVDYQSLKRYAANPPGAAQSG